MENAPESSSLIGRGAIAAFTHKAVATTCNRCANRCPLTVNTFGSSAGEAAGDVRRYISGNKCERGAGEAEANALPNLMQFKLKTLLRFVENKNLSGGKRRRVGLPLVLNMYENLPFWAAFFAALGCEPIVSGLSSREVYMKGQQTIPSDTVCYPAKLVHGHIELLLEQQPDFIFYPSMSYNFDEGISDNCYNCPVVAYYPEVVGSNMAGISADNFVGDHISLNNPRLFERKILDILSPRIPGLTAAEVKRASKAAYRAYEDFRLDVLAEGERALARAEEDGLPVAVMASRPYHSDPEINHGVDKLLTSLGFAVVTEDAIPREHGKLPRNVLNQWTYHARMYNAAQYVAEHPNAEMVQLVSFGCGLDAITSDEVRDILRYAGKLYTQLKIDEINNLGAAKIRMRSLKAAMLARKQG
jgi:predicted nucleotide-binding protein (sugar kinase/HSP70/actin superfamily)